MSAQEDAILLERAEGVATICFNRPKRLNALDLEMARRFSEVVDICLADATVRVIVVAANGRAFMAGGDLSYFDQSTDKPGATEAIVGQMHKPLKLLAASDKITLGSIKGAAAGGGMSLALGLDLLIASSDTKFSFSYTQIGTSADCGGSWILPRLVGMRRALQIALLDDFIDANSAERMGLVNAVVAPDALEAETKSWASRLAKGAPIAQGELKRLIRQTFERDYDDALDEELKSFKTCAATDDFAGAVSAFLKKENYAFTGR